MAVAGGMFNVMGSAPLLVPGSSAGMATVPMLTAVASRVLVVERKNSVVEAGDAMAPWLAVVEVPLRVLPAPVVAGTLSPSTTRSTPTANGLEAALLVSFVSVTTPSASARAMTV